MIYIHFQDSKYTYTPQKLIDITYTKGQSSWILLNLTHIHFKKLIVLYDHFLYLNNICM